MADYLKKFATQADYDAYIEAGYPKPNVSYIVDNDEIIFTNYQDGEDAPDTVVTGMKIADFKGTTFNNANTYITEAYIPDGVTTIGNYAFSGCNSLTSVTISDTVTKIGEQAFVNCNSLTSVTIPDAVTSIGGSAFSGCKKLTSLTIPNSVVTIGSEAFFKCTSLTSVTIPDGVTSIYDRTFIDCSSLASVTIGNSVTSIGKQAFQSTALTSIDIPGSVTSIDSNAFNACTSLASVTVRATTPPTLGYYAFQSTHANLVIYVPAASVDAYKAATNWSTYADRIQAISE